MHILRMQNSRTGGCPVRRCPIRSPAATPRFIVNCHCGDCRKATAPRFSTWVGYDSANVSWVGQRSLYVSSPTVQAWVLRQLLARRLSYSGKEWITETHLLVGVFDERADLVPTSDAYAEEKLDWVALVAG